MNVSNLYYNLENIDYLLYTYSSVWVDIFILYFNLSFLFFFLKKRIHFIVEERRKNQLKDRLKEGKGQRGIEGVGGCWIKTGESGKF